MAHRWHDTIYVAIVAISLCAGEFHGSVSGQTPQSLGNRIQSAGNPIELEARKLWRLPSVEPDRGVTPEMPSDSMKPAVPQSSAPAIDTTPAAESSPHTRLLTHADLVTTNLDAGNLETIDLETIDLETIDLETIDLGAIDLKTIGLRSIDVATVELRTLNFLSQEFNGAYRDIETVAFEAIECDAMDAQSLDLAMADTDSVAIGAIAPQTINTEPVKVDAVEVERIAIDPIEFENLELETVEVESIEVPEVNPAVGDTIDSVANATADLRGVDPETTDLQTVDVESMDRTRGGVEAIARPSIDLTMAEVQTVNVKGLDLGSETVQRAPADSQPIDLETIEVTNLASQAVAATVFQPAGEAPQFSNAPTLGETILENHFTSGVEINQSDPTHPSGRPRILFQPAVPTRNELGQEVLRPSVRLADLPEVEVLPTPESIIDASPATPDYLSNGRIPSIEESGLNNIFIERDESFAIWSAANVRSRVASLWHDRWRPVANLVENTRSALARHAGYDAGVGRERLPFALSEIDSSQPLNNFRIRFDSAFNLEFPDRAEYFWSKIGGKGPGTIGIAEPSVDYQQIRMLMEVGTPRLSVGTEIPLVFIDPTLIGNTVGLGDMTVTTKTVMIDGDSLQLTQILRTQMPTGTPKVGRGNGHTSMEPGLIARYKWSEETLLHSELKLWFPMGADPDFSGEVLRYGFGYANVFYDSDSFAVIPTLEMVGWSVLSGQKTGAGRIDNENIINFYPGMRIVCDGGGDLGLFELGLAGGVSVTERHWYRGLLRLDLRWSF